MSLISNLIGYPGRNAVGVIDFGGAAEAGSSVTVGDVVFQEADAADAPNGVWTNGATAADSATSFAAAVNGDARQGGLPVSAFVTDAGDSVVLYADNIGSEHNYQVTTDSVANVTVEDMRGGEGDRRRNLSIIRHVVTAQEVLGDEVNEVLPFTPNEYGIFGVHDTNGAFKATQPTGTLTLETDPARLRYNFAGATDPVAGDVITFFALE